MGNEVLCDRDVFAGCEVYALNAGRDWRTWPINTDIRACSAQERGARTETLRYATAMVQRIHIHSPARALSHLGV